MGESLNNRFSYSFRLRYSYDLGVNQAVDNMKTRDSNFL